MAESGQARGREWQPKIGGRGVKCRRFDIPHLTNRPITGVRQERGMIWSQFRPPGALETEKLAGEGPMRVGSIISLLSHYLRLTIIGFLYFFSLGRFQSAPWCTLSSLRLGASVMTCVGFVSLPVGCPSRGFRRKSRWRVM